MCGTATRRKVDENFSEEDFMFENEIAVNELMLNWFNKVAKEIPDDLLFHPSAGHGHPPVWIMGHLTIVGEMGQRTLGGTIVHPEWLRLFGPGSSDIVPQSETMTKTALVSAVTESYNQLRTLASGTDAEKMARPHTVAMLDGSPIKTVGQCVSHVLTSHFSFHLAQLSCCRRTAGFGPLF